MLLLDSASARKMRDERARWHARCRLALQTARRAIVVTPSRPARADSAKKRHKSRTPYCDNVVSSLSPSSFLSLSSSSSSLYTALLAGQTDGDRPSRSTTKLADAPPVRDLRTSVQARHAQFFKHVGRPGSRRPVDRSVLTDNLLELVVVLGIRPTLHDRGGARGRHFAGQCRAEACVLAGCSGAPRQR